jgi:hypothetical protein
MREPSEKTAQDIGVPVPTATRHFGPFEADAKFKFADYRKLQRENPRQSDVG